MASTPQRHAYVAGNNVLTFPVKKKVTKTKRVVFRPRFRTLLFGFVLAYMIFSFGRLYLKVSQADQEIARLEQQRQELQQQQKELEAQIEMLHDDRYIQKLAREKLGLVMPGEAIVIPGQPGKVLPLVEEPVGEILD